MADGSLLPRCMDLGRQAQIRVNDFFPKNDFWVLVGNNRYQKETFCISEVVSVGSTNTYNFLPTDTKNCFRSIV
jgi:hypothetical protein